MSLTFVTTTSYGSWPPGDMRGYVRNGVILPGNPELLEQSRRLLKGDPVCFSESDQQALFESLLAACQEFGYRATDVAIESWHLHWIVWHGDDAIEKMVRRLKTRMRQALARGRVWTEGYCGVPLYEDAHVEHAQGYIARHGGCRMTRGRILDPQSMRTPGRAGG